MTTNEPSKETVQQQAVASRAMKRIRRGHHRSSYDEVRTAKAMTPPMPPEMARTTPTKRASGAKSAERQNGSTEPTALHEVATREAALEAAATAQSTSAPAETPTTTGVQHVAESKGEAMGTWTHCIVVTSDTNIESGAKPERRAKELAALAEEMLLSLEGLWSRFLPNSEISQLNKKRQLTVSAHTFHLIEHAIIAWQKTDGLFDPSCLDAVVDAGYDRTVPYGRYVAKPLTPASSSKGCAGIVLDRFTKSVSLPDHVSLDLGGIAKGYAADVVTANLISRGADGVMLNIGGDLRARGTPPDGDAWSITVTEPMVSERDICTLRIKEGAVATSTPMRRRWLGPEGERSHLIDPRIGNPVINGPALVTTIAGDGWWAEAAATALASHSAQLSIEIPTRVDVRHSRLHNDTKRKAASRNRTLTASKTDDAIGRRLRYRRVAPPNCAALIVDRDGAHTRLGPFVSFESNQQAADTNATAA